MNIASIRSRWAAVGAAVAVSLGAGGIGITHATISSGERAVFVPLDNPCRLASTRPAPDTVGPRTTGIGPDESYTLDGWGTEGNCTLPSNTAALALNVTAVNATQQTNLRFFPADAAVPTTANLNPSPGAAPTPNAVNVNLDSSGQFKVFNKFGVVQVVIDVMGYYEDHNHDDRYYTKAEIDQAIAQQVAQSTEGGALGTTLGQVASVTLNLPDVCPGAPDSWNVLVQADGYFLTGGGGTGSATIALSLDGTNFVSGTVVNQNFDSTGQFRESYSTAFLFTVDAGAQTFYELGSRSHPAGVTAAQNNLIAESVSVDC